jgi:altronate dehydratase large subunit
MSERPGFFGFPRPDGRVGVRNHVLVVPTVVCASVVCERIAAQSPSSVVALPHQAGCGQLGPDMWTTHDTLAAYCGHPNVGAVVVVALGCEQVVAQQLAGAARAAGKPCEVVAIQAEGGSLRAIAAGTAIASRFAGELAPVTREWCDIETLVLSLKCGGSDYTSGLASNPALGRVADRLVDLGGATVLGEVAEIMGAEHLLAARAAEPEAAVQLVRIVDRVEAEALALGLDIRGTQPSPGNIRGGLTTIEEKSLGATHKGGETSPLTDVVPYAGRITRRGLTVMDTPGLDVGRRAVGPQPGRTPRRAHGAGVRAGHPGRNRRRARAPDRRRVRAEVHLVGRPRRVHELHRGGARQGRRHQDLRPRAEGAADLRHPGVPGHLRHGRLARRGHPAVCRGADPGGVDHGARSSRSSRCTCPRPRRTWR